jgi:hypothetical protein
VGGFPMTIPGFRAGSHNHAIAEVLLDELAGGEPTTNRFLFYRCVDRRVVDKEKKREPTTVSEVSTKLRRKGLVPYSQIVDRSRGAIDPEVWRSLEEAVEYQVENAVLNPWLYTNVAPLLVVESDSLAGLLEPIAYEYSVPLLSFRGQASESFLWQIAEDFLSEDAFRSFFYLGDWDKSGHDIEANARERLSGFRPGCELVWKRLAITDEQVDKYDLPVIQKWDKRSQRYYPAVETEALGRAAIVALVRGALERYCTEAVEREWRMDRGEYAEVEADQRQRLAERLAS